ncbi:MAG TPA: aminotransferase class IV [Arachnia sp.]|jgi:4-amino-4-deoxychorismate lyase|nr:aminotransferase class IV [Arachnia sp.]
MAVLLIALLDGTLVDPAQPIVRADDQGVVRGDGVFDALLAVRGRARDLDPHLERLAQSARMLDLPAPDEAGYRRAVDAVLAAWDWAAHPEAVLRMILTRGPEGTAGEPNGWVMAAPLDAASRRQRSEGVRVLLLDRGFEGGEIADLPWLLPGAKSLSYGINMAAKRYAVANGADDVIFRAPSGKLLEGPTSSVVLDLDGVLVTPPLDGILRSITIEELVNGAPAAGLEVRIQELHRDDLGRCRGAWLLSSGRILARVTHVDGQELPSSPLDVRLSRLLGVPWR